MKTIQTTLHQYSFDTTRPEEARAYDALVEKLMESGAKLHRTWGGNSHYNSRLDKLNGVAVQLETNFINDDQWNTAPIEEGENGLRVFDWAEDYPINFSPTRKRGHYLEITEEMRELRRVNVTCGYCGHMQLAGDGDVWCGQCLGSEYLKEQDLHLTRLVPAGQSFGAKRAYLNDAEIAERVPLYVKAQTEGNTDRDRKRIAKEREKLLKDRDKAIETATIQYEGYTWMMGRGIRTANVIYYTHTGRFSMGWREKLSNEVTKRMQELLAGFPYPIDLETTDGKLKIN